MFDEDLLKIKASEFPKKLDDLSVQELEEYILELREEITRVKSDIQRKKASAAAADSIFK